MRWFVEVSRVGEGSSPERYCLEAKAWQAALQEARKLRGDSGPLSKFSIELLDDGYRAVDPVQKIRYFVSRAPEDAPLVAPSPVTNGAAPAASSKPSAPAPGAEATTKPAKPSSVPPPLADLFAMAPPDPEPPKRPATAPAIAAAAAVAPTRTPIPPASPAATRTPLPSTKPSAAVDSLVPTPFGPSVAPAVAASVSPAARPPRPSGAAPAAAPSISPHPSVSVPATVPLAMAPTPPAHRILSTRVETPKADTPITYREEVYVVEPGTSRESTEILLIERFERVRSELASSPPGQLVRLAVFDVEFEGKPPHPPLGTLAWKDWRGAPVLGFPYFGEAAPPMTSSLPPRPSGASDVVIVPQNPAPSLSEMLPPEPKREPAPAEAPSEPVPAPEKNEPATPPETPAKRDLAARPRQDSKPDAVRRGADEDLVSELFERLHELVFASGVVAGAGYVLDVLMELIPSELALVQVFDLNARKFVVVQARGPGLEKALLEATPDTDELIAEVMHRPRALTFEAAGDARFQRGRWRAAASPLQHVLCGAVQQGGRYLGMIELANPVGGKPYGKNEINALDYACEQFAEYVATHPVVIDRDVVLGG